MNSISDLLSLADAFAAARGLSESRVSTLAFSSGARLKQLRAGGDIGTRTLAQAIQWFSDHWPDSAAWPAGVHRPEKNGAGS